MANILSQEEIDALLGAAERGELKDDGSIAGTDGLAITDYNFRRPNLITKDQLREFTNLHEAFVREAQTSLSLLMRISTEFRMVSTEQQQYSEFIGSLPTISHLALYSAEPLPGSIAIEINLALVFGLVDLRLGGSGGIETSIRQPTELEVAIIEPIIRKISNHLQDSWKDFVESLKFKLLRYESNPEYLQAAPADAPMVVLAFEVKLGAETNGIINICYPVPMILALLEKISSKGGQMDNYYGKAKDVNEIRKRLLSHPHERAHGRQGRPGQVQPAGQGADRPLPRGRHFVGQEGRGAAGLLHPGRAVVQRLSGAARGELVLQDQPVLWRRGKRAGLKTRGRAIR